MITPMDIHNKQFTKATVRGYSEEEVNDFLNQTSLTTNAFTVNTAKWKKNLTR